MQLQQMLMAALTFPASLSDPFYKVSTTLLPCRVLQHCDNCFSSGMPTALKGVSPSQEHIWWSWCPTHAFLNPNQPNTGKKIWKGASQRNATFCPSSETVKSGAGQSSGLTVPQPGTDVELTWSRWLCPAPRPPQWHASGNLLRGGKKKNSDASTLRDFTRMTVLFLGRPPRLELEPFSSLLRVYV